MKILLSLTAAVMMAASPLASVAGTPDSAAATAAVDPARLAIAVEVLENLHMFDLTRKGVTEGLKQSDYGKSLTADDLQRLIGLCNEEVDRRRQSIIEAQAIGNTERFTLPELNDILAASRLGVTQRIMLNVFEGKGVPDEADFPAEDLKAFNRLAALPHVDDFIQNFDYYAGGADIDGAMSEAVRRFEKGESATGT